MAAMQSSRQKPQMTGNSISPTLISKNITIARLYITVATANSCTVLNIKQLMHNEKINEKPF